MSSYLGSYQIVHDTIHIAYQYPSTIKVGNQPGCSLHAPVTVALIFLSKSNTFRSFQFTAHMRGVRDITNTMLFNNQKEGTKSAAILEYYKTNYTLTEHL